jgi:hypothetical protein
MKQAYTKNRAKKWRPTEAHDRMLGTASDMELSCLWGVSHTTIRLRRVALGIAAYQKPIPEWRVLSKPYLGKMSDRDVAAKFSVSMDQIIDYRHKLKIPAYTQPWEPNAEQLTWFGKMPDVEIGEKAGVTEEIVRKKRIKLGIRPFFTPWKPSQQVLDQLGKVPDRDIAAAAGTSHYVIAKLRKKLGIEALDRVWNPGPEIQELFGKITDAEIARMAGVTTTVVRFHRMKLGVAALPAPCFVPSPEQIAQLGTKTDEELALEWGEKRTAVSRVRKERGIPMFKRSIWTPEMDAELGTCSDHELSRSWGINRAMVSNRRRRLGIDAFGESFVPEFEHVWSQQEIKMLGTMPDNQVAKRLGVSTSLVWTKRNSLGIPPFKKEPQPRPRPGRIKAWEPSPDLVLLLGKSSDKEIAKMAGVSAEVVFYHRKKHGIAAAPARVCILNPEQIAMLGILPDRELVKLWGFERTTIRNLRLKFGAETYKKK